jgi:hypothetical protein
MKQNRAWYYYKMVKAMYLSFMKNLPVGIQSFQKIREGGYLYVDKTAYIYNLATDGSYYFLSRPRRFGKSLLVNTLAELFQGNKELFEGLWIEDKWDWSQKYPVIQIGFSSIGYKTNGLEEALYQFLEEEAVKHKITLTQKGYDKQLKELVNNLFKLYGQVVILIDEYDKPIIDFLDDTEKATTNRDTLKTFYSVLKDLDDQLRMVFITGVSKFSRVSIFSELNNLTDLTMLGEYASMLGYTQEELEENFSDRIESLANNFGGKASLLAQLKDWYNGYSWHKGQSKVYNPFSVLSFFHGKDFDNFWFASGTPSFLVKLLKKHYCYDLEDLKVTRSTFESFALDNISPESMLFQTGYVTLKGDSRLGLFHLGYPNREVRDSMIQHLMSGITSQPPSTAATPILLMAEALADGHIENLIIHLNALLSSIPHDWHQSNEAYYHTIMHLAFSLIGVHIQSELHTAKGVLDSVIHTDHAIYVLEFKVDKTATQALIQIAEKGYADPYRGKGKPIIAIGINFSSEKRKVEEWKAEEVS